MKFALALATVAVAVAADNVRPQRSAPVAVAPDAGVANAPPDAGAPAPQVVVVNPAEDAAHLARVEEALAAQTQRLDAVVRELEQLRAVSEAQRDQQQAAAEQV